MQPFGSLYLHFPSTGALYPVDSLEPIVHWPPVPQMGFLTNVAEAVRSAFMVREHDADLAVAAQAPPQAPKL